MQEKGLLDRLAAEYGVLISDLRLNPRFHKKAVDTLKAAKMTEAERRTALAYLNGKEG